MPRKLAERRDVLARFRERKADWGVCFATMRTISPNVPSSKLNIPN
jgi:hypothetical protein